MSEYHWDSPEFVDFDYAFLSIMRFWIYERIFTLLYTHCLISPPRPCPCTAQQRNATRFTAVSSWRIKATRTWFSCLVDGVTLFFSEKQSGKHSHHDCECEENLHVDVLAPRSILQSKDWLINKLCSFI